jgi:hypothetical protein
MKRAMKPRNLSPIISTACSRGMRNHDPRALHCKRGVGEWARHDLSPWYPGWAGLVVAAHGLDSVEAARFGFEPRLIELP